MLGEGELLTKLSFPLFFMQIIQKSEQFTDEQVDAAINEEIRKSLKNELDTQEEREVLMRAHAASMKNHKSIPGLGKCVAVMPAREFFRLQAEGRIPLYVTCWYQLADGSWILIAWPVFALSRL